MGAIKVDVTICNSLHEGPEFVWLARSYESREGRVGGEMASAAEFVESGNIAFGQESG